MCLHMFDIYSKNLSHTSIKRVVFMYKKLIKVIIKKLEKKHKNNYIFNHALLCIYKTSILHYLRLTLLF